jgi:Apea-like HEPN
MDEQRIGAAVEELRAKVVASEHKAHWAYYYLEKQGETADLERIISEEPELAEFNACMRTVGTSATPMSFKELARSLVGRAVEADTETALAELTRYLGRGSFPATFTIALAGIVVHTDTDLGHGVKLIRYTEDQFLPWPIDDPQSLSPTKKITAALTKEFDHPKRYHDQAISIDTEIQNAASTIFDELEEARLCLGILKPSMSMVVGRCLRLSDRIPICGPFSSQSWSVHELPPQPVEFNGEDLQSGARIYTAFHALENSMRKRLAIPMSRLQNAMFNHFPTVDDLIDLGIAVEATFLGDYEQGELTFRIAMRGSRLLGADAGERKEIKDLLSAVYKMRSQAVHRGIRPDRPPRPFRDRPVRDVFLEGCNVTARALRTIVERGGVNWEQVEVS